MWSKQALWEVYMDSEIAHLLSYEMFLNKLKCMLRLCWLAPKLLYLECLWIVCTVILYIHEVLNLSMTMFSSAIHRLPWGEAARRCWSCHCITPWYAHLNSWEVIAKIHIIGYCSLLSSNKTFYSLVRKPRYCS